MSGRVALVTGATGTLGTAITRALCADGTSVVVADLDGGHADGLARRLTAEFGLPCWGQELDVADPASAATVLQWVGRECRRLDALVNCAGIQRQSPFATMPIDAWNAVLRTNLTGPFVVTQAALQHVWTRPRQDASVVNIVSRSHLGGAKDAAYSASKGGLASLTLEMAVELGPLGIRANGVSPSFVRSPLQAGRTDIADMARFVASYEAITPLGRLIAPEDVANTVAFLASERARGITGQIVEVSAGAHLPAQPAATS